MSSSVEIIEQKTFAHTVAEEIRFLIEDSVNARGHCSIALAGGKTPSSIYRLLSLPPFSDAIPWDKVSFFWGDERWVDHTDSQSNYHMVKETLLSKLLDKKPQAYPVNTKAASPEAGAVEYEATIRKVTESSGEKIPMIDIVLLGIGEDGHTASLFPKSPALKEGKRLCVAVETGETTKQRVTLTFPILLAARRILFIVSGANKAEIVKEIIEGRSDEHTYPASFYKKAEGVVTWFLDGAAGNLLSRS